MLRKLLLAVSLSIFAFAVLFISVLRTAALRYEYNGPINEKKGFLSTLDSKVDYTLPFPGGILPDHPLWTFKVMRDRVWILLTPHPTRKVELHLLFADKRLGSAKMLFERNKPGLGVATLERAERYLIEASVLEQKARAEGIDTTDVLDRLARASLRHYEVMMLIYESAPDEIRPTVIRFVDSPKNVYENARNAQLDRGITPYENPFGW